MEIPLNDNANQRLDRFRDIKVDSIIQHVPNAASLLIARTIVGVSPIEMGVFPLINGGVRLETQDTEIDVHNSGQIIYWNSSEDEEKLLPINDVLKIVLELS